MAIKWSNATLNPFESAYNKLRGMELFNEYDWNTALRRGENDLNAYIGTISESDKIDISALNNRYLGKVDKMDFDTRMLMYQNELFGDKNDENRKERKFVTGYDENGDPIYDVEMLNDYEYNDKLLQDWAKYQESVDLERLARYEKHNANFGEKILYGLATTAGLGERFVKGFFDQTMAVFDFIDAIATSGSLENFRQKMSDDMVGTLDYWSFSEGWDKEVHEWSSKYTYLYDVSGEATWAGKYLANASYSIGQMMPALLVESATAGLFPTELQFANALNQPTKALKVTSQIVHGSVYYGGMMAQNLRDTFNAMGEDVSTYRVLGKVALETGLDYIIEIASAIIFGAGMLDRLALGMTKTSLTGNIIGDFVKDVIVEGAEETVQEFTSWLSTNIFAGFDRNDPFYQTLDAQTLVDSFILGAISSIATGGVDTIKNVVKTNIAMKDTLSKDEVYQHLRKASKKQARQYKAGLVSFMKSYGDVMNELNSWETIESAKTDGAIKVTKQMIASYNTLMSFYGEFGEQRVQAAENLLTKLTENAQSSGDLIPDFMLDPETGEYAMQPQYETETYTIEDGRAYSMLHPEKFTGKTRTVKTLKRNLKPLRNIRISANLLFASVQDAAKVENLKKAVAEVTSNGDATAEEVGNVQNVYDSDKEQFVNEGASEQATKTAKELADKGKEVVLTDNTATILEFDDVIFVPMADIENLKADEILQAAEVRTVVTTLIRHLPKSIVDTLVSVYSKYNKKADKTRVIYNALFNQSFYNIALMHADKETMELLVMLDNVVTDIMDRKSNKDDKAAYEEIVHKVRKTMGASIVLYACNNYKVPLESLTVLNETQKDFVRKHRYNQMLADRLIAKTATEADLNVLRNRINSLILTKQEKAQLYADITSDSSGTRKRGINTLDEKYNYTYRGKYNDIIYMSGNDVKSCMFNEFARINEITLENFLTERTSNKLQAAVIEAKGSYSLENRDEFLKGKFEIFTNNNYTIDIVDTGKNKEVVIVEKDDYEVTFSYSKGEDFSKGDILQHDSKNKVWSAPASDDKLVRTYYLDILDKKISSVERAFITMEDIVSNPNIYLSDKVKQEILDQYGIVNKQSAYSYLSNNVAIFSNNRLGLSISNEGTVNIVSYVKMSEYLNKTVMEPAKSTTTLFDNWVGKNDEPLSTFVNTDKLPEEFKNITVRVIQSETNDSEFNIAGNKYTIVISSGRRKTLTNALFRVSLMHELHHAIQYFNNEAEGFTDNYTIDKSVVDDIRAHVPEYINKGKTDADREQLAKDFIYYNAFGEIESVGRTDNNLRIYPVVIKTDSKKDSKVTMPWGSTFTLSHKDGKWTMKALYKFDDVFNEADSFYDLIEHFNGNKLKPLPKVYYFDTTTNTTYDRLYLLENDYGNNRNNIPYDKIQLLDENGNEIKQRINYYTDDDYDVDYYYRFEEDDFGFMTFTGEKLTKREFNELPESERYEWAPEHTFLERIKSDVQHKIDTLDVKMNKYPVSNIIAEYAKTGLFNTQSFDKKEMIKLIPDEYGRLSREVLRLTLAPDVDYETFINMDIPFIRIQDTDKVYDTGFISASVNPYNTSVIDMIMGETDIDKQYFLLVGTFKPKDLIAFLSNELDEGFIDTSKLKSVTVYPLFGHDMDYIIHAKDGKEVFVDAVKSVKAKSFTDKPAKTKNITKKQNDQAKKYIDVIKKLQNLNRQSDNFKESVAKISDELKDVGLSINSKIVTDIENNRYVNRTDERYVTSLKIVRSYYSQEQDKLTARRVKALREREGLSYDTESVTKKLIRSLNAEDTALSFYSPEKHESNRRLTTRMINFLVSLSEKDLYKLNKIDEKLANDIIAGKATQRTVEDFIYRCERDNYDMEQWLFVKIRNAFFPNSPIKNFSMIKGLTEGGVLEIIWSLSNIFYDENQTEFLNLTIPSTVKNSDDFIKYANSLLSTFKKYDADITKYINRFQHKRVVEIVKGRKRYVTVDLDLNFSQAALTALRYYDGTLDSLYHIASVIRKIAFYNYPVRQVKSVSGDTNNDTESDDEPLTKFDTVSDDRVRDFDYNLTEEEKRKTLMITASNYLYDFVNSYTELGKFTDESLESLKVYLFVRTSDTDFSKLNKQQQQQAIIKYLKSITDKNTGKISDKLLNNEIRSLARYISNMSDKKLLYFFNKLSALQLATDELSDKIMKASENIVERSKSDINNRITNKIRRLMPKVTLDVYKLLPDKYKKYFYIATVNGVKTVVFDKSFTHYDRSKISRIRPANELLELEKELEPMIESIKSGYYNDSTSAKIAARLEKEKRKNERLNRKLVQTRVNAENKVKYYTEIHGNATFNMHSDTKLPQAILEMMQQTFGKTAKSTTKFLTQTDQRHMRISAKKWVEDNAETLEHLTPTEVEQAIDFFENAIFNPQATEGDIVRYEAFKIALFAYWIQKAQIGELEISDKHLETLKTLERTQVQVGATVIQVWRDVLKWVDPLHTAKKQILKGYGIDVSDEDLRHLTSVTRHYFRSKHLFEQYPDDKNVQDSYEVDAKRFVTFRKELQAKYEEMYRNNKKAKQGLDKWLDTILKIQKAMMLSAPSTWVRSWESNFLLTGVNATADFIGTGMFKLVSDKTKDYSDGFGKKIHDAATKLITYRQGQYNLTGVKITEPVHNFIKTSFLNNGFYDMIKEGLTAYDARELDHVNEIISKHKTITDKDNRRLYEAEPVISLMINNIISEITRNNTFGNKADKVINWIFKIQQDDWFIKKQFVSYLGKIIVSQNIDITKGYTKEIFDAVAAAYGQACYDYVHRPNFINQFEAWLRKKNTGAYLGYKLVAPFLASSWNWFTETLDMNPVMLGRNIYKLIRLEHFIDKYEKARKDGEKVPFDPRFTEMIVRRKIGKGAIGTVSMFLGMMLAAFGILDVDEEDDKIKLHLWDYTVDISKIYGASSLLFGAVLANPKEGSFWDVIESAFNMTFEDSIITTVLDMFRYKNTPAEFLSSTATNILMGFIPNLWKSITRAINYKKIKYSKGFMGTLQYFVYTVVPGAFKFKMMDVQIDPYTGKEEYRYTGNAFWNIVGELGLVGRIKDNKPSQIELVAKSLGLNKGPLTGEYDIGKVDYGTLNRKYGELNNEWLSKLINDKMTYEVKNKNGNFVSMLWSKMTNEQKISALNGITSKNAHVAKVYAWTNQGGKYYTNSNERLTLAKTYGITENIYIGKDKVFSK